MGKDIRTEYGLIDISRDVIASLAGAATTECFGVVGVVSSNLSDGISELLGRESLSRGVDVSVKDDALAIRVHVVVGYGSPISVIADNIVENVKYSVERYAGLRVDKVIVSVEGVRLLD